MATSALAQLPVIPASSANVPPGAPAPSISGMTKTFIGDLTLLTNNSNATATDRDAIKAWGDQSGNGYTLQQLGGTTVGPIYNTSGGPSGGALLTFRNDASNSDLTNKVISKTQVTVIIMVATAFSGGVVNGAGDQLTQINYDGGSGHLHMYAGTDRDLGPLPSSWNIHTFVFNNTSSKYRTNGVAAATGFTVGTGGLNGLTLGAYFNGTTPDTMQLVHLEIWNGSAPSDADLHAREAWICSFIPAVPFN